MSWSIHADTGDAIANGQSHKAEDILCYKWEESGANIILKSDLPELEITKPELIFNDGKLIVINPGTDPSVIIQNGKTIQNPKWRIIHVAHYQGNEYKFVADKEVLYLKEYIYQGWEHGLSNLEASVVSINENIITIYKNGTRFHYRKYTGTPGWQTGWRIITWLRLPHGYISRYEGKNEYLEDPIWLKVNFRNLIFLQPDPEWCILIDTRTNERYEGGQFGAKPDAILEFLQNTKDFALNRSAAKLYQNDGSVITLKYKETLFGEDDEFLPKLRQSKTKSARNQ